MDIDSDNKDGANEEIEEVTKYFTMPASFGKNSPWWERFELFIPMKHPTLFKDHVLCKECATFRNNLAAGIVKNGLSQSTSNLRSHKKHHHPTEYNNSDGDGDGDDGDGDDGDGDTMTMTMTMTTTAMTKPTMTATPTMATTTMAMTMAMAMSMAMAMAVAAAMATAMER